ncbi:SpoIIE family protein phosphatase [Streptomyces actinomycinicus]|uniref:protein-serine/threonine phosphatase n=1 Tax=Streptomyces actinomycinicus TaxID=1695166 RepID=A0A937JTA5_9ACTN|nr:SpoIIE family protein phosphatase [Streptomyces actinomycinicus]MBL1086563.1 SpoIIE family protein phosphatase [Streptomyces actinomycinicus]
MTSAEQHPNEPDHPEDTASSPSGLMDLLGVAAVLLEADGRIDMWSPQAEQLFGYTGTEALGQYAAPLLLHPEHQDAAIMLFAQVMETGRGWAGAFPIRHKDGSTRMVEFRNMRLTDSVGDHYALGLATDRSTLRQVERSVALSTRLVTQAPIGLAILDTDLRYLAVNPAMAAMHSVPVADHVGRTFAEIMPGASFRAVEAEMRQVLASGIPVVDQQVVGPAAADQGSDHAWAMSLYRLEDQHGTVLGIANVVVDVTDRYEAARRADRAQQRLRLVARGSARIGTTLEVERTAQELAEVVVPDLADMVAVDLLDSILQTGRTDTGEGPALFRVLAVKTAYPTDAARAIVPPGRLATYHADHPAAHVVRTREPHLISHVASGEHGRIAADPEAARLLAEAGVHSDLAVPLIAREQVIGVMGLARAGNPLPFDDDDVALACELASIAALSIDNAVLHHHIRSAAETLQRSLLPQVSPRHPGLEVAARYLPAQAFSEVGGDWYDVITLRDDRTALTVGDVMGSGIEAATTMGRLRTATATLANLNLGPARILKHLDEIILGLDPYLATCVYAIYDPHHARLQVASAGHLPPVLTGPGRSPELLDLPTGAPLGVGGVLFESITLDLKPGDQLVFYTDGLVETRNNPIDERLNDLLSLLTRPDPSAEDTCDRLLQQLRQPGGHDDVALLIARAE